MATAVETEIKADTTLDESVYGVTGAESVGAATEEETVVEVRFISMVSHVVKRLTGASFEFVWENNF